MVSDTIGDNLPHGLTEPPLASVNLFSHEKYYYIFKLDSLARAVVD